jgi:AraC-like DNA-binding protein
LALEEKVKERTLKIEKQKEELSIQAENLLETNILLKEHGEELEAFSEELKAQGEELYRANEELVKLNATKDRFYNIVAHELKNLENDTSVESANEQDRLFLEKIIKVIEENISDPDFTLDHLAEKLHLSRSTLYRKIISVTEQHPKEIIKTIRFQQAGRLIKQGTKSISQVMYEVGITEQSHFEKTFKNMFCVLPSKYKNEN